LGLKSNWNKEQKIFNAYIQFKSKAPCKKTKLNEAWKKALGNTCYFFKKQMENPIGIEKKK